MPDPLSLHPLHEAPELASGMTHVIHQRRLARLLAFAGRSIDDVVNCSVAKRHVAHYYKTDRLLQRRREILDLESQWNSIGRVP